MTDRDDSVSVCFERQASVQAWGAERTEAWLGLLRTSQLLIKSLDAELAARHGIGMSGFDLLSRLDESEEGHLRMSDLASLTMLSPSRVSRLVDQLGRDGYVERRVCPSDGRAVWAVITENGRDFLAGVRSTYFEGVERRFFEQLREADVKRLAGVWERLSPVPAAASSQP